jgi:hypothetical protein
MRAFHCRLHKSSTDEMSSNSSVADALRVLADFAEKQQTVLRTLADAFENLREYALKPPETFLIDQQRARAYINLA